MLLLYSGEALVQKRYVGHVILLPIVPYPIRNEQELALYMHNTILPEGYERPTSWTQGEGTQPDRNE
jgi:hypothetical protein